MAVLVDAQGEMLDNIENMVTISSVPVEILELKALPKPFLLCFCSNRSFCFCSNRSQVLWIMFNPETIT